ncbi:MAG: adenylosuccinate lyase [Candidatus Izemoplasmatales bacterium]|nr:adenylosuccinate lyase [Candidatus Izemoplasmatales bacterium]
MIERYVRPEMAAIWTDENKFKTYLKIELLNAEALMKKGIVSPKEMDLLNRNASFSLTRIAEIEQETKHDIIAFTRTVSESLGAEKRFIHYGLTSSDIIDTATGCLLKQANQIIEKDLNAFVNILKKKAILYKDIFCMGRTHGMHADVTTFGLKWTLWYAEMKRNIRRFKAAAHDVECGKISGAVGNYAFTGPEIETYVCNQLGIDHALVSTQILQRDRHAYYLSVLALIGATLEKIATEIRHLQRTEIKEVSEAFATTQKGSSAMPHKRNPISCENICGLARVLRGYNVSGLEDIALWHERDISHSSVERIVLPDATQLIDYMLNRFANVLDHLEVYPEQMRKNIDLSFGTHFSQRVLTALVDKGLSRESAYDFTQTLAKKAMEERIAFKYLVCNSALIKEKLTIPELETIFNIDFYKQYVNHIYTKVFSEEMNSCEAVQL